MFKKGSKNSIEVWDTKRLKLRRHRSGQAMVEFALSIPFVLLLLVAILYFGRYFFASQTLLYAAQEGARSAAKIPNLSDPSVRDSIRGFTVAGEVVGPDDSSLNPSPVYCALSAAKMLSGPDRAHGGLPPGATVKILPWDDGDNSLSDTVTVLIQYPFGLSMDWKTGKTSEKFGDSINIALSLNNEKPPVSFANMTIQQSACAGQEIYQQ